MPDPDKARDPEAASPAIALCGLHKVFRDFWRRPTVHAVRGVDLNVRRGEVFGLLGPNGSGKSTTIKLILGLLHPTRGSVRVFGARPNDTSVRARLGYLPEVACLHRYLTATETLHYYAALSGLDRDTAAARTRELLEMVGLSTVAHRAVGSFSKGMSRRVGLAQALIGNPELVILDEPTAGLDPIACRAVKDLVKRLAAGGRTVLMTSHLLADVEDVCDRVAVLHDGVVRAEGRLADLLLRPESVRLLVNGMDDSAAAALAAEVAARTGRPVHWDHPSMDLETFFLKTVREAEGREPPPLTPAPFLNAPPDGVGGAVQPARPEQP